MTTLKEYKAMMEGATDAPWRINIEKDPSDGRYCHQIVGLDNSIITDDRNYYPSAPHIVDAGLIVKSVNIAPDLIRVIELAEEALLSVNERSLYVPAIVDKTLSEIRKLKGE